MPGGDRTGPAGMGPMTGRAAGYCAGAADPGFVGAPSGGGFRGGGGGGGGGRGGRGRRGRRNQFRATGLTGRQRAAAGMPAFGGSQPAATGETGTDAAEGEGETRELDLLKRQAAGLAGTLDEIKKRIAGLEAQAQGE